MPEKRLRALLEELHRELTRAEQVDENAEQLLRSVMSDIRALLGRAEAVEDEEREGLSERLRDSVDDFEEDHPRLALTVRRVLDTLSRL